MSHCCDGIYPRSAHMKNIVGLDLETTGIGEDHKIIEYCGLVLNEKMLEDESRSILQRFNPQRSIDAKAQAVHHISLADLMSEPIFETKAEEIHEQLKQATLIVIHNAAFDTAYLNREFKRLGMTEITVPTLCTMRSARWATYDGKVPRLQELCSALGVIYNETEAHSARYDVEVMLACFCKMAREGYIDRNYIFSFNQISEELYLKADGMSLI